MDNTIVKYPMGDGMIYLFVVTMTSNNMIHGLVIHSESERTPVGTTVIISPNNVESTNIEFK